jgi:Family of unknown function (DUF6090)
MIKFFRHIRRNLMETGKTGKYLKYALGEIILVVIGILIALQINNWNEKRKLNIEEIKLLTEMKMALISDQEDIISNIKEHSSAANSCVLLLEHFSKQLPYNDTLDFHFANALNTTRFSHTSSPYETLKIKGPDLIENDLLRGLLGDYYDKWVGYQFELQRSSLQDFDSAKERQFELFQSMRLWDKIKPVDYATLAKSTYYSSWLSYTASTRKWEAENFRRLQKKTEQLLTLIESEIQRGNE